MSDDVFDELRNTGEHVAVFNEIAKALTSTLELHEVLRSIMHQISLVVRPTSWALLLEDEKTGELRYELAIGDRAANEELVRAAFKSGQAQVAGPNEIALPLRARGKSVGVINLALGPAIAIERDELQALKAIADYAAIAIHNARNFQRLQELTITDDHTGLFNARHLRELLPQEIERALRFNHPLSLLFIDLDYFKAINDTHGHVTGSVLLREFGRVLSSSIRKVDSAFRYGGDEFAVMLVETDAQGAMRLAKRLQTKLERHLFLSEQTLNLQITASFGVATFPDDAAGAPELLQAADQAMYRAKARGRNTVVGAGETER
jgi:diguanylate cyclase (GGDEF)-like protein